MRTNTGSNRSTAPSKSKVRPSTVNTIFEILQDGNPLEAPWDDIGRFKKELPNCLWNQARNLIPNFLSNSRSASRFVNMSTPAATQIVPHKKLLSCAVI